jgi:prepilin-type processing-associated H-X9-DG protein
MPNLQVLLEKWLPRNEDFICVNRPWWPGEPQALNLPWKRSPVWQCEKNEIFNNWYTLFGSSFQYISRPGFPNDFGAKVAISLCDHRVDEVGEPSRSFILTEASSIAPHGNGSYSNALCVDGHAAPRTYYYGNVRLWNFATGTLY